MQWSHPMRSAPRNGPGVGICSASVHLRRVVLERHTAWSPVPAYSAAFCRLAARRPAQVFCQACRPKRVRRGLGGLIDQGTAVRPCYGLFIFKRSIT